MYNRFQVDQDLTSNQSGTYKNNINERTENNFMAGTITKGFFSSPYDENDSEYMGNASSSKKETVFDKNQLQSPSKQGRKRREKRETAKLTPINQAKQVEVFQNIQRNDEDNDIESIELTNKGLKVEEASESQIKKRSSRRRAVKKEQEQKKYVPQPEKTQEKIQQQTGKLPTKQTPIFFEDDEEETSKVEKIVQPQTIVEQEHVNIPQPRINNEFIESDEQPIEVNTQQIQNILTGSQYFNFSNQVALMKQLNTDVRDRTTLKMEIIRDKDGFNTFWPEFHLHFAEDSHYVMSAKKTASRPTSTFIMSRTRGNYEQSGSQYLGKMKSNVLGDILNIFGPGLNPTKAKQAGVPPRQLLATIVFMTSLFQMGKPREFRVFIKKPEYQYYSDFSQVRMYQEEISLNTLAQFPENKQKIRILHNRQPVWVKDIGGYMLNFRGRVERPSIKNFIIQQSLNGPDVVLFGKVNDNKFNFDVSSKISVYIAFAIALSSFDSRLMCE